MKYVIVLLCLFAVATAQDKKEKPTPSETITLSIDSILVGIQNLEEQRQAWLKRAEEAGKQIEQLAGIKEEALRRADLITQSIFTLRSVLADTTIRVQPKR